MGVGTETVVDAISFGPLIFYGLGILPFDVMAGLYLALLLAHSLRIGARQGAD